MDEKWQQLKEWIQESQYIVFFGGAGVSTESKIPDFRSEDGLYRQKYKYPPETIISHSFYMKNAEEFYRFYKDRMIYKEAVPNDAHRALAKLEQEGKVFPDAPAAAQSNRMWFCMKRDWMIRFCAALSSTFQKQIC